MSNQSVSKPILWWCAVLLVVILFCLFAYQTGYTLYHNQQLRDQFSAGANSSPYQQGIQMEKMDLTVYNSISPEYLCRARLFFNTSYRDPCIVAILY